MEMIERLSASCVEWLAREFAAKAWPKSEGYFAKCFAAQERGELVLLVAAEGDTLLGYVKVVWVPESAPFREAGIPEIQDLNVVPAARGKGVATRLMDRAEALIGQRSAVAGIAVGLHPGYGAAQRMYARRGYVPDGKPLQYHGVPVREGQEVRLDNDLVMNLTKKLTPGMWEECTHET
jgi:GNAT superfamily N-acetyltransferase